jgi:AraC-like DNA-binding protein
MVEIFDNIKKIYQFSAPCGELADYIEFFSESSVDETALFAAGQDFRVKMFPSWTPTFWINLGAPYRLELGKKSCLIGPEEDILIVRDSIAIRHNLPTDYIFTVKFFPGGLEAIFGISQVKMIGKPVDLRNILPDRLIQDVKRPGSFENRMEILQNFLLLNYHRQKKKDHYIQLVRDSMDAYTAGNMQYNTGEIAEKMFISSKTINRYFNTVVGTGPKKYFSIVRIRAALTAYLAEKKTFIPGDYGYHDMSHFYKEVQKFTNNNLADNRS